MLTMFASTFRVTHWSEEGRSRLYSSFASILILASLEVCGFFYGYHNGTTVAMICFASYLLSDTLCRSSPLAHDTLFHHLVAFFVVGFGLYKNWFNADYYSKITPFLYMEVTTPVLHMSWIFYNEKSCMKKQLAKILFPILILLWVPFRLYFPSITVYRIFYTNLNDLLIVDSLQTIFALIVFVSFVLLQFFWFYKLMEKAFQLCFKKEL